ncbi:glycosyltransferase family 2 protein [Moorena producens JHB]|uniref:Glycosyltransferase family 2 protein n=1 Tax=Moorena producens (strain JHB) TaxID=1454205 RepID=A0A1D9G8F5_MOOP1|nr:glycosyltransferase family 2 protein [Moorena producens]AOY83929.1 glycosyltransferase family 2 protein [Moorena producens JHB]
MKLTVIVPTFNRAELLAEAIDSILRQSPPVYEIVISDDGSSDATQNLCKKWQQTHYQTRIVVTRSSDNLGAQVARNRGMKLATGDAILFMDSDDVLADNGVLPLVRELQCDQHLDYVYGQVLKVNFQLEPIKDIKPIGTKVSPAPVEIAGYHWHTMGAIYRRDYLRKVGCWNEKLTGSQDWEFQARVKLAGGQGKFVEHVIGLWRDHSSNRVGTKSFRYDYVESVVHACLLIRDKSWEIGIFDRALERRLARKIMVHALEFAVNGYDRHKSDSLHHAIKTLRYDPAIQFLVRLWQILPNNFDFILWQIINYGKQH